MYSEKYIYLQIEILFIEHLYVLIEQKQSSIDKMIATFHAYFCGKRKESAVYS